MMKVIRPTEYVRSPYEYKIENLPPEFIFISEKPFVVRLDSAYTLNGEYIDQSKCKDRLFRICVIGGVSRIRFYFNNRSQSFMVV